MPFSSVTLASSYMLFYSASTTALTIHILSRSKRIVLLILELQDAEKRL